MSVEIKKLVTSALKELKNIDESLKDIKPKIEILEDKKNEVIVCNLPAHICLGNPDLSRIKIAQRLIDLLPESDAYEEVRISKNGHLHFKIAKGQS